QAAMNAAAESAAARGSPAISSAVPSAAHAGAAHSCGNTTHSSAAAQSEAAPLHIPVASDSRRRHASADASATDAANGHHAASGSPIGQPHASITPAANSQLA